MKIVILIIYLFLSGCNDKLNYYIYNSSSKKEYLIKNGLIPNRELALTTAKNLILTFNPESDLNKTRFSIELLQDSIWVIKGEPILEIGEFCFGGTYLVNISKKTGEIKQFIIEK